MNFIKVLSISLLALSLQFFAEPVNIELKDKTVQYDSEELKVLKNSEIEWEIKRNSIWNGKEYVPNPAKSTTIKFPYIDSKAFGFIMQVAKKDAAAIFKFIDSLDDQAFKLLSYYAQMTKSQKLSEALKLKMLKEPRFKAIAQVKEDFIRNFMYTKVWINDENGRGEHITTKYLNKEFFNDPRFDKNDGILHLLVLIHFYQEHMKQPLSLTTDHLKKVFNEQPDNIKQTLVNKNLVTLV